MQPRHPTATAAIITAAISAALLLLTSCGKTGTAGKQRGQRGPIPVQVATAVRQTLPVTQNTIGNVLPLRTVSVRPRVDGVIEKIHFQEGNEVREGDLLITLDRLPFENALRIARADLINARAQDQSAQSDYARYKNLLQASLVSQTDYDQYRTKAETARADVAAKEAAVSNAELHLGYTEIRAPIAGRTGQLVFHEGSVVKATDAAGSLLVINQISPIAVAYSVPEHTLLKIHAALAAGKVLVTATPRGAADAPPSPAQGRLDFVDNTVDPTTGTILLKAVFPNTDRSLWPGQFVTVVTELAHEADTILVPTAAVQNGQKGRQVFVVTPEKTVQLRIVKTGIDTGEHVVILDGVAEGETVVTDGQLRLTHNAKVEIKNLDDFLRPAGK